MFYSISWKRLLFDIFIKTWWEYFLSVLATRQLEIRIQSLDFSAFSSPFLTWVCFDQGKETPCQARQKPAQQTLADKRVGAQSFLLPCRLEKHSFQIRSSQMAAELLRVWLLPTLHQELNRCGFFPLYTKSWTASLFKTACSTGRSIAASRWPCLPFP